MSTPPTAKSRERKSDKPTAVQDVTATIQAALLRLTATRDGYEGLIGALLNTATNDGIRLMASGDQFGVDGISDAKSGVRRAMQSKRYKPSTTLGRTSLLGEMAAANAAWPAIDSWIIASTRPLQGAVATAVSDYAEKLGWGLVSLDWTECAPGLPRLAVLCAAYPDVACRWKEIASVRAELDALAAMPVFSDARDAVLAGLRAVDIGFASARRAAVSDLSRIFVDPAAARAIAGASPTLLAQAPPVIRSGLRSAIQTWWTSTVQTAVLLGIEGMGKTWGAIDALRHLSTSPRGPLPVVISAQGAAQATDGLEAVVAALARIGNEAGLLLGNPEQFWQRRLALWGQSDPINGPTLLILVDGLDELDPFDWSSWLAPLQVFERAKVIRLLLTCRDDEWHHRMTMTASETCTVLPVGKFTPEERDAYLRSRNVDIENVSAVVLEAALHPRTAFHLSRLADELGDLTRITREQLLLRDFQNLCEIKGELVGPQVFQAVVRDLAERAQAAALRQQAFEVTAGDVLDSAADFSGGSRGQMRRVLGTLVAGTWLERDSYDNTRFTFSDVALPDAIGFALARLIGRLDEGAAIIEIDRFLEPWGADDLIEKVLRTCATALVIDPLIPDGLCRAVLQRWRQKPMHGREGHDFWRRLHVFRPMLFLDLCEQHGGHGDWLLEWGIASFWEDHIPQRELVEARLRRWLTTIGIPAEQRSPNAEDVEALNRERNCQLASLRSLEAEEPGVWTDRIGLPEETLPEMGARIATRVLGLLPRMPFIPIFRDWALNCAAVGRIVHSSEIEALLRDQSPDDACEAFEAIRALAVELQSEGTDRARTAAAHLLRAAGDYDHSVGSEEAVAPALWQARLVGQVLTETGAQLILYDRPRRPNQLIHAIAPYIGDHAITLAPDLAEALAAEVSAITWRDLPSLYEGDGPAVAVLLRWHADAFYALLREYLFIEDVADDDGEKSGRADFRRIAVSALPILDNEEASMLAERLEATAGPDGSGRSAAIALRLAHQPFPKQIAVLLACPQEYWPHNYQYLLNKPGANEFESFILDIDFTASLDQIKARLGLANSITERFGQFDVIRDWKEGFTHADIEVQRDAMHLADDVGGKSAARQFEALGLNAGQVDDAIVAFEMSSLLNNLDDDELRRHVERLDAETLGHVYLHRPALRNEVLPPWRAWIKDKLCVARSSWSFGSHRVIYNDRAEAFAAYAAEATEDASCMVREAWANKSMRGNILHDHGEGPAWPLIRGLALFEPELVKEIWQKAVADAGGFWAEDVETFPVYLPAGPSFDDLRATMLTRPKTDAKVFDAVRVLEKHGHTEFLIDWIKRELTAVLPAQRARAITVAGFLDASEAAIEMWDVTLAIRPKGWLGNVHDVAERWFQCAFRARHWYLALGKAPDEASALRALWLLGSVGDQRVWLFFKSENYRIDIDSWRVQWLDFYSATTNAILKASAKGLEQTFLHGKRPIGLLNAH